ncbi:MAG TPA: sigma factor-like helix-turn-helix DNA-binding protein, partial [Acidimicrobiales bacterium]|nr:sigma factor-like helix-turn-helix DNA-binding protein [Acidimicrobiales bacterium]
MLRLDRDVERAVDRDAVVRALRQLSPGHRTVLVLRYFEDLSEPEIAARRGARHPDLGVDRPRGHRLRRRRRRHPALHHGRGLRPGRGHVAPIAIAGYGGLSSSGSYAVWT